MCLETFLCFNNSAGNVSATQFNKIKNIFTIKHADKIYIVEADSCSHTRFDGYFGSKNLVYGNGGIFARPEVFPIIL